MDAQVTNMLKKMSEYIEHTQIAIDKATENREAYIKRAEQTAKLLARKGVLAEDQIGTFVSKVAENENGVEVWNLVDKLASALPSDELGNADDRVVDLDTSGVVD